MLTPELKLALYGISGDISYAFLSIQQPLNSMSTKATPKSRSIAFQMPHLVAFGLEITERHPNTPEVTSVRCNFCTFRTEKKNQVKSVYVANPSLQLFGNHFIILGNIETIITTTYRSVDHISSVNIRRKVSSLQPKRMHFFIHSDHCKHSKWMLLSSILLLAISPFILMTMEDSVK